MSNDTRYPYTYACDFIRALAGYNDAGCKLSRADASQIRGGIAKALAIEDEQLARKLADYAIAHEAELTDKSVADFMRQIGA